MGSSNVENVVATPAVNPAGRAIAGDGFVGGTSPAMSTFESVLPEIAATNIPVLLVGECGTGKQMFAHRIHQLSHRSSERLIKISCAAARAESLAAELGLEPGNRDDGYDEVAGNGVFHRIREHAPLCRGSF